MVGILLTCGKHLHDHIISSKGKFWTHKTSLSPSLFIDVPVPSQEHERSYIYVCVRGIDITSFCDFRQCVFAFFHFDNKTNYVKLNLLFTTLPYNLYLTAVYVNKRYRSSLYINILTRKLTAQWWYDVYFAIIVITLCNYSNVVKHYID